MHTEKTTGLNPCILYSQMQESLSFCVFCGHFLLRKVIQKTRRLFYIIIVSDLLPNSAQYPIRALMLLDDLVASQIDNLLCAGYTEEPWGLRRTDDLAVEISFSRPITFRQF